MARVDRIGGRPGAKALAAVVVLLTAVFALATVSVVDARRPLDGKVTKSFAAAAKARAGTRAQAIPLGCPKRTVDYYDCSVDVRPRGKAAEAIVRYFVSLHDDGCWLGQLEPPLPTSPGLSQGPGQLKGCLPN